ncbi:MAG: cytochrome b/b6 domain-containing protein [Sphingomonadales bacterium]|nr:cytochrome b/b6 domain-containing protein [Sphingomonadales bacterium]
MFRHALATRLWHWANAVVVIVMLMSGATISNAHRFLYWGQKGAMPEEAWLRVPRWPGWMTLPSHYDLSSAREWHLAFAWVLAFGLGAYLAASLVNGHVQRDLTLGRAGSHYHTLQKLVYCGLLFGMVPLLIGTGLALSPGMNAAWPWLLDLFGGRQSARTIHFLLAGGMAAFLVGHVALVLVSGPAKLLRGMLWGGEGGQ